VRQNTNSNETIHSAEPVYTLDGISDSGDQMSVDIHPKEIKGEWDKGYVLDAHVIEKHLYWG
jgi:hypothetical protein